jgi:hypothetical protein
MSQNLQQWFDSHSADYQKVLARLNRTRSVVLAGDLADAADILEKAYVNAVLSIKTEKERHERAFTGYYVGNLSLKEAALETVYGGNKKNWLRRSFDKTDWVDVALAVRSHARHGRWQTLLDAVVDNLVGVSHRKGAFLLAMSGFHEFVCVDSNVAQFAGLEESEGNALEFDGASEYMDTARDITDSAGVRKAPPFLIQWAIYDYQRGEHARHMPFYQELPI